MSADYLTIIGRYDDSGDATVAVVAWEDGGSDPHLAALRHMGRMSEAGEFSVIAVLRGDCQLLVTRQSLQVFAERMLRS